MKNIAAKEKGNISDEAIKLIARTSEGSVRDSVSLLDRALISQSFEENKLIEVKDVRLMLGLADKSKVILLLKDVLSGKEKEALSSLKDLLDNGVDARNFLNDMLEILYLFSRRINLGSIEKDMTVSEAEGQMIDQYSKNIEMQDIGLFWQLTIKTIDDLRLVGNENLILEMYIIQLIHLKNLDEKKKEIDSGNSLSRQDGLSINKIDEKITEQTPSNQVKNQLKNINQIKSSPIKPKVKNEKQKIEILSFDDLILKANKEREIELKYDLERNVKLVNFSKGKINIGFNEKLNKNFIKNLTEKLLEWTGDRWIISLSKNIGAKSIYEKNLDSKADQIEEFKKTKLNKDLTDAFPDIKLIDIKIED